MEGRRVSRRKPRRNPLYVLFMGLLALSLVLLITVVVLGFKLKSARSDLAAAQGDNTTGDNQTGSDTIDWLDLTGHDEVSVKPSTVYDKYYIYYTTGGVNLRSGPSTSYGKVQLVDRGTKVKAAAKEGNWTFVSVGSKFGWISSDYLSTKPPVEVTSGSLSRT